jgi:hypothetical protein
VHGVTLIKSGVEKVKKRGRNSERKVVVCEIDFCEVLKS